MKRIFGLLALCLFLQSDLRAISFPQQPDQTILSNGFRSVTAVDSFVVATTRDAVCLMRYDSTIGSYRIDSTLLLPSKPDRVKRSGELLWISTTAYGLIALDLRRLPTLQIVHSLDFEQPFLDFSADSASVYLARGFSGVQRFRIDGYSESSFADSSMLGIHCVQVELIGQELYVLDDYNGVLRYKRTSDQFGDYDTILYLPLQATSFALQDSTIVIASRYGALFLGQFGDSAPILLDSAFVFTPEAPVLLAGEYAISLGKSGALIASLVELTTNRVWHYPMTAAPESTFQASILSTESPIDLLVPDADGGLSVYVVAPGLFGQGGRDLFHRPGPITSLQQIGTTFVTGGTGNPIDLFQADANRRYIRTASIFDGVTPVADIAFAHDSLFAIFPSLQALFILTDPDTADWEIRTVLPVSPDARAVTLLPWSSDTIRVVAITNPTSVDIWRLQDTLAPQLVSTVRAIGTILDVALVDSILTFSTNKRELWFYRMYSDLSLEFRSMVGTAQPLRQLVTLTPDNGAWSGNSLFGFEENRLISVNLTNPQQPMLAFQQFLPTDVESATLNDTLLYTIGDQGISVYSVAAGEFSYLASGGRGGNIICAFNGLVAASDGHSVSVYDLGPTDQIPTGIDDPPGTQPTHFTLDQNYPNPFNPTTTIRFSLSRLSAVRLDVFNLLGQQVAVLADGAMPSGDHFVEWDGRDQSGNEVATGLYFYRLQTSEGQTTRKMVLVR